jgi:hypothetical protein
MNLYEIARQVTDEVLGEGTYAELNKTNPNPQVQKVINEETFVCCSSKPDPDCPRCRG